MKKGVFEQQLLLLITLALVAFGLVMVFSATSGQATLGNGDALYYLRKQGLYALVGVVLLVLARRASYRSLRPLAPTLLVVSLVLLVAVLALFGVGSAGAVSTTLVINEVDYDQVGADANGFVEIANTGGSAAALDGISLVLVNGGDGLEYARVDLTGSLAAGAYLSISIEAQNGAPDGVALIDTASGALLDALSYEGEITAAVIGSQTYNLVEGTALAATVADSNTVDGSLSRIPDGQDTNNAASDWAFTQTKTPGAANVASP